MDRDSADAPTHDPFRRWCEHQGSQRLPPVRWERGPGAGRPHPNRV